ncbi:MAG: isocitrate/isopropylmalate family dehydrogenase [Gemmatimonadaceae bacterium]
MVRVAANIAKSRSARLTSVDKANVLETSRLWRRVTTRVIMAWLRRRRSPTVCS